MDEINHVVITDFDKKTWGTSGVKWARSLKNLALPGVALDFGIPPEGKETIAELGLSCVPGRSTYNSRAIDRYDSVIGNGIPPGVWLLCPPDFALTSDTRNLFKLGERKLVCKSHTLQPFFLVFPVVSIENRVKVSALVEEKVIKKYGDPMSASWVCGPSGLWELFWGLYRYSVESGIVERRAVGLENLILNLFAVTFDGSTAVI